MRISAKAQTLCNAQPQSQQRTPVLQEGAPCQNYPTGGRFATSLQDMIRQIAME
jgi:hypothetical protein